MDGPQNQCYNEVPVYLISNILSYITHACATLNYSSVLFQMSWVMEQQWYCLSSISLLFESEEMDHEVQLLSRGRPESSSPIAGS